MSLFDEHHADELRPAAFGVFFGQRGTVVHVLTVAIFLVASALILASPIGRQKILTPAADILVARLCYVHPCDKSAGKVVKSTAPAADWIWYPVQKLAIPMPLASWVRVETTANLIFGANSPRMNVAVTAHSSLPAALDVAYGPNMNRLANWLAHAASHHHWRGFATALSESFAPGFARRQKLDRLAWLMVGASLKTRLDPNLTWRIHAEQRFISAHMKEAAVTKTKGLTWTRVAIVPSATGWLRVRWRGTLADDDSQLEFLIDTLFDRERIDDILPADFFSRPMDAAAAN